ncbi:MAG: thiamine diphosphokinase [Ignavibacteria bacterium]|jgi:thiamine pyrophosphokinase
MKKCIILANGDTPPKNIFKYLKEIGYKTLICADGGANNAYNLKLNPDYIIGDLDSIKDKVKQYYSEKCKIIHYKRQNDTDVEKCLKFAIKKGYEKDILHGVTGDRLDHTFCNLGIVMKFFDQIKVSILHCTSFLEAFEGNVELETIPGETISLYAIEAKTKITTKGLKYKLENEALPFGVRESTSNVAKANKVKLKIKNGRIFVIRDYETLRQNGFLQ